MHRARKRTFSAISRQAKSSQISYQGKRKIFLCVVLRARVHKNLVRLLCHPNAILAQFGYITGNTAA